MPCPRSTFRCAGGLSFIAGASTRLADAHFYFSLTPTKNAGKLTAADLENAAARRAAAGLAPLIRTIMEEVLVAQLDPQCAATVFSPDSAAATPMLPVDSIIMDEAACSTDFVMPCLLAARPANLVRASSEKTRTQFQGNPRGHSLS